MFSEKQQFRQIWLLLLLGGIFLLSFYQWLSIVISDHIWVNERLVPMLVLLLVSGFILSVRLTMVINKEGLSVQFFPIHFKPKFYAWDSIQKAEVRTYSPIQEFGGWGYRIGLFGAGKALNISGNKGLQLYFKNGQKLLIGTQVPEKLSEIIAQMNK
jgi:hypothetical protein